LNKKDQSRTPQKEMPVVAFHHTTHKKMAVGSFYPTTHKKNGRRLIFFSPHTQRNG
jgi:hypothetical protein